MSAKSSTWISRTLLGLGLSCSLGACLQNDAENTASAEIWSPLNLASPPHLASGRSTIEGRYVYAQPDEGEITIPMFLGGSVPGEFSIVEPSMKAGSGEVKIKYSKKKNLVELRAKFKGLPYRGSWVKDYDNSSQFNVHFNEVHNAKWQLWFVGTMFGRKHENAYYSASTLKFLGTKYNFAPFTNTPPPAVGTYFPVALPMLQMVCTPIFEGKPNGEADVTFKFRYDRIEDALGSPGALYTATAFDACLPDKIDPYWTNARLPDDQFMSFDTFLQSIWNGEGIAVSMSAEPDPKPAELAFRDNTFIGWSGMYPALIPPGYAPDSRSATGRIVPQPAGSYQVPPNPPSRRNLCGGGQ